MPRCPLCRSALLTITFGLYPIATCTSCGARWIQDGHQQRAINQIQEPSLMAEGRPNPAAHSDRQTQATGGSARNRETEPTT
jgi:Zn-finger nucleic acid-binding protein